MIQIYDIPGGIHPPECKEQSLQLPLAPAVIPQQVVLPLSQHIGTPASAIVEEGDTVLTGQLLAEPQGIFSVGIHATVSGTVVAIEDRPIPHSSGMSAPCVVIESDGRDQWIALEEVEDYTQLDREQLLNKIRNAGLAGMGGAGFPSAVKLNPRANHNIDTLIINGTECEPYITADDILMREKADEVIQGTLLLAHLLGNPKNIYIGIEDNKPTAIDLLRQAAKGSAVEVVDFPTKYPSGGEKQLIQILTGKEVGSGEIPASLGIVCQNVGTTVAAWQAVRYGRPLVSRITTVVGEALDTQRNIEVRFGTLISEVLEQHGFSPEVAGRLIMGGPMMGFAMQDANVPVVKTTNCILAPSKEELPEPPPAQACIRCGLCAEACPASLLPQQLYWYAQSEDFDRLQAHNLMDCIECGACSFVCPSNIPLVQYYRASKGAIKQAAIDKQKSDRSRERFEFRQARLDKAEAEKEAKRQARKEAAEKAKALAAEQKLQQEQNPQAAEPAPAAKPAVADPDAEKAKLERALSSAQNRLEKARERLDGADESRRDKMAARVKEAELKVSEAQTKLDQLQSSDTDSDDPVAAAIARAKAKAALPPHEKLKSNIDALQKRMTVAEEKLIQARQEGAATADALQAGLDKMLTKMNELQQELKDLGPVPVAEEKSNAETAASLDPAAAAIERAKAKALAAASMSPAEKLRDQIASMQTRIAKTTEKVAAAKAEGAASADALQLGLDKMTAKLDKACADLKALEPDAVIAPIADANSQPEAEPELDAASAAIAKAKAKAAATAAMSPEEKLRDQIASMQKRIDKTSEKVAAAKAEGADSADALQLGLDKMTAKLEKAKSDLAELET